MEIKQNLKGIWNFLWNEDSLASWIISLVLAFIIVKFIFFPFLSLLLSTSMPLVVVESTSMHHESSSILSSITGNSIILEKDIEKFWQQEGNWYENEGITKQKFSSFPLTSGLEMGDIVLVRGGEIEKGDIIIFQANKKYPIIHRVVEIKKINNQTYYETKGDNNSGQLVSEQNISENTIIGKAVFKIPKLGWVKLGLVKLFS